MVIAPPRARYSTLTTRECMVIAPPRARYSTLTTRECMEYMLQPNDILNDLTYKEISMQVYKADPKEIEASKQQKDRPSYSVLPNRALRGVIHAFRYGAKKYGRLNWRDNGDIKASIYFDAAMDHMVSWWEGEDRARDSGINHLDHAIAGLLILRDAELQGGLCDDRPLPLNKVHPKSADLDMQIYQDMRYDPDVANFG